jgi:hypothetical protein
MTCRAIRDGTLSRTRYLPQGKQRPSCSGPDGPPKTVYTARARSEVILEFKADTGIAPVIGRGLVR